MPETTPAAGTDAHDVWVDLGDGRRLSLPWNEIAGVVAYTIDCMTHTVLRIDVEHESGHVLGLDPGFACFDAVMASIVARLPGANRDWRAQVDAAGDDAFVVVWRDGA